MLHYRYTWVTGKEPLTYYDMNLSAQDHQTFFTGDIPQLRPEDAGELIICKLNPQFSKKNRDIYLTGKYFSGSLKMFRQKCFLFIFWCF